MECTKAKTKLSPEEAELTKQLLIAAVAGDSDLIGNFDIQHATLDCCIQLAQDFYTEIEVFDAKDEPIHPMYTDYTVKDFKEACYNDVLTNDDGRGVAIQEGNEVEFKVNPSDVVNGRVRLEWATGVRWYPK